MMCITPLMFCNALQNQRNELGRATWQGAFGDAADAEDATLIKLLEASIFCLKEAVWQTKLLCESIPER